MIESLELRNQQSDETAHDVHKWEIHNDGTHIGHVWVAGSNSPHTNYGAGSPEYAPHLTISVYPLEGQPALKIGYRGARDLVQHLAQIYPQAETVGGERKTGTHSKSWDWPYTRIRLDAAHARNVRTSSMAKTLEGRDVEMPRDEFEREHRRLVRVLRSGTKREREREATGQERELQSESYATLQVAAGRDPFEVLESFVTSTHLA